ncbi:hypothetical protein COHA_009596 [Chlorella ohadii]|uniref:Uncharacterized protein n=1 Tax=Chlorella ohadii TaxID=2649997 RepID=A0AAD5DLJ4_9CHLO|nr:hypothetical protein COHA_009596 [Chlorella ohadii]
MDPGLTPNINMEIGAARFHGPVGRGQQTKIDFTGFAYKATDRWGRKTTYLHGPTIRVRQGMRVTINFKNNIPLPTKNSTQAWYNAEKNTWEWQKTFNGSVPLPFVQPEITNLHVHGGAVWMGIPKQLDAIDGIYRGGDHVTYPVYPTGAVPKAPATNQYKYWFDVPRDHSPGMSWVHPHWHGSATGQDNYNWFPGAQCAAFRETLRNAEEKLLRFNVMTFAPPTAAQITTWFGYVNARLQHVQPEAEPAVRP